MSMDLALEIWFGALEFRFSVLRVYECWDSLCSPRVHSVEVFGRLGSGFRYSSLRESGRRVQGLGKIGTSRLRAGVAQSSKPRPSP